MHIYPAFMAVSKSLCSTRTYVNIAVIVRKYLSSIFLDSRGVRAFAEIIIAKNESLLIAEPRHSAGPYQSQKERR